MGDIAFPCFRYAKQAGKAPAALALALKDTLEAEADGALASLFDALEKLEIAGGYLNFFIRRDYLARTVLRQSMEAGTDLAPARKGLERQSS